MIVSEAHRQLANEAGRLWDRLGLESVELLPGGTGYLVLVPALHAIVDRIEKLEAAMHVIAESYVPRLERLEKDVSLLGDICAKLEGRRAE